MKKTPWLPALFLAAAPLLLPTQAAAKTDVDCTPKAYEMALRYQQRSAEVMALQLQAYHLASLRFRDIMASYTGDKKPAIVLDLDETVIDNSALLVRDMQNCHDYTQWDTWGDWEKTGHPTLIPGALPFLKQVDGQQVKIFYVSDRFPENKADTVKTLQALALPQAAADNTLLDSKSKKLRRDDIEKDYNIIMLFGDSLPDFAAQFKNKESTEHQRGLVQESAQRFGNDWIVLPNAGYGSWSSAKLNAWQE